MNNLEVKPSHGYLYSPHIVNIDQGFTHTYISIIKELQKKAVYNKTLVHNLYNVTKLYIYTCIYK